MTTPTIVLSLAATLSGACGDNGTPIASGDDGDDQQPDVTQLLHDKITNVVVIYAENRGFDNMYGNFPGANGVPGVSATSHGTVAPQRDRDANASQLAKLPQSWNGVTAAGFTPVITQAMSDNLANKPYALDTTYPGMFDTSTITRDLVHRFYENQMQINGGANDKFTAYSDAGGLVMGYIDGSHMALWDIASHYVLADNFFMGAFGGSFLNHQYLICACAPEFPNADTDVAKPTVAMIDSTGKLVLATTSPASAIDGPPTFALSGNLTPKDYFGDGTFRAVNTMQPPYQPSANAYAGTDASHLYADRTKPTTLPPQTETTIGDQLTDKGVSWKWYAGAWTDTTTLATGDRVGFPNFSLPPGQGPNFQFHHHPFNYFATMDPAQAARAQHLKDYTDLVADIDAGTLPAVTFYKPEGDLNQHSGYASVRAGDEHIAQLIEKLEASPQFEHMIIVITYDENGGWWDHVSPPSGDKLGPGMRIPAIIVSPYAKAGTVDHTQYDTASILRLLARRFDLSALPGVAKRDAALVANGGTAMGDLTGALELTR